MHNLFLFRKNVHKLRNIQDIANENKHTVRYGLETVSYGTSLLWVKLPDEYKLTTSLSEFKSKSKGGNAMHALVDYAKLFTKI